MCPYIDLVIRLLQKSIFESFDFIDKNSIAYLVYKDQLNLSCIGRDIAFGRLDVYTRITVIFASFVDIIANSLFCLSSRNCWK